MGSPTPQVIIASEANTDTTEAQEQQEAIVAPTEASGQGTATADAAIETHTEQAVTPEASMEVCNEQADTADAPAAAANPTEPIAHGPTIASSGQVTSHKPIWISRCTQLSN